MKYLRVFETTSQRDQVLNMVPYGVISYVENGDVMIHREISRIPNNEIRYISSDGNVVTPYNSNVFGANIVNNAYENGVGVITFDDDVTRIGDNAFQDCTRLTSVIIPDSVTSIRNYAFSWCDSLTSITIGNSVTRIGEGAFNSCTSLTSVTIGNSVTRIEEGAFDRCSGLTSITIPNSVTSIGNWVFEYCTGLTSFTIPGSVTTIGQGAFDRCSGLTSVTIGDSVTSIGDYAFRDCSGITSITSLNTTPPTINSDTLPSGNNYIIYVPAGSVETYKAAQYWSDKASQIQAMQS